MHRFIIFILAILNLIGCDVPNKKLLITNLSKDTIYYNLFYDTSLSQSDVIYLPKVYYMKISPNDSVRPQIVFKGDSWEYSINHKSKDSSLYVFYFNTDTVRKYDWKNIIRLHKYQRVPYKVKDLDSLHWNIIYDEIK